MSNQIIQSIRKYIDDYKKYAPFELQIIQLDGDKQNIPYVNLKYKNDEFNFKSNEDYIKGTEAILKEKNITDATYIKYALSGSEKIEDLIVELIEESANISGERKAFILRSSYHSIPVVVCNYGGQKSVAIPAHSSTEENVFVEKINEKLRSKNIACAYISPKVQNSYSGCGFFAAQFLALTCEEFDNNPEKFVARVRSCAWNIKIDRTNGRYYGNKPEFENTVPGYFLSQYEAPYVQSTKERFPGTTKADYSGKTMQQMTEENHTYNKSIDKMQNNWIPVMMARLYVEGKIKLDEESVNNMVKECFITPNNDTMSYKLAPLPIFNLVAESLSNKMKIDGHIFSERLHLIQQKLESGEISPDYMKAILQKQESLNDTENKKKMSAIKVRIKYDDVSNIEASNLTLEQERLNDDYHQKVNKIDKIVQSYNLSNQYQK